MRTAKAKSLCSGCREHFYNGNNDYGIKECWNFKRAKIVKRYRIHWWTPMTSADNFTEVTVLDCYRQTGSYAYLEQLPEHLRSKDMSYKRR